MTYNNLIKEFIENFPELEDAAKEEIKWWESEEPPVHVFFGNVLNPFLIGELSTMETPKLLDRIFDFLEAMAVSDEKDIREVLITTVLERLGDDKKILENARAFMRSKTRKMSDAIEEFWGRL